jgi:hypothetical protein
MERSCRPSCKNHRRSSKPLLPSKSIRVLAFSDFGTGGEDMKRTAAAALAAHRNGASTSASRSAITSCRKV